MTRCADYAQLLKTPSLEKVVGVGLALHGSLKAL